MGEKEKPTESSTRNINSPIERLPTSPVGPNTASNHTLQTRRRNEEKNNKSKFNGDPRILKRNSVEAINRQNVISSCKKSSGSIAPIRELKDLKKTDVTDSPLTRKSPSIPSNS